MRTAFQRSLFIDASGWIAINDPRDGLHAAAVTFYRDDALTKYKNLVTTNLVVAETHALLLKLGGRNVALKFLARLDLSTRVEVVFSNPDLGKEAYRILLKYQDQRFSYCDAVSFAVMKELDIKDAFAFDRHFETAGFRHLPKASAACLNKI